MNLWNEGYEELEGVHCLAEYKEQIVPENQGNPFIEALPNRLGADAFSDALFSAPMFRPEFLELEVEDRIELSQQIRPSFWLPFPSHYDKYRGLYTMIKIGYQSRNPLTAVYNRQFAIGWDKILENGLDENGANIAGNIPTAQSLSEIGLSGMGKSKIYERILKQLFPQVIHHHEYKDRKLLMTQVVWLHIECPSQKSLSAFCRNFYAAVDKILGSNYYEKHGEKGGTADNLKGRMVKVAAQINLGLLIIDEIQNIHRAHSGGDETLINFITELVNTIGIPTIIIGTFKAMYIYKNSLANSRRGIPASYNENITSFLLEDSWDWNQFVHGLWDLQYTAKYTPLTEELKATMYFHSIGIPDIAVKLYMHVQQKAILVGGDERITVPLIDEVASKSLRLFKPISEKIRRGEDVDLKKIEDIEPDWASFNDYIEQASFRMKIYGKLAQDHARSLQRKDKNTILEELTNFVLNLVPNAELAESLAISVYNATGGMGDKQVMFKQVAQLALESNHPVSQKNEQELKDDQAISLPKLKKPKKMKPPLDEEDIRYIVKEGLKKGISAEEALEEVNIVREWNDFLKFCM
ncbi:hypothetical protein BAZO_01302 [Schinkia azotoformans LMG 9581]|uniref:ORC1/DEAH AAA+ ATPase domain-containing protein n=2 Tax=Schinkia azotoformans TaxID=1454 RepID=K6DPY4_SCHAZ|nr:hypothetical protein BAZO_01302 [Schinkia azotoformans LMG 9581]